ncbi:hypothetical protein TNCV_1462521 [Trichonephila clavipes]|nr:hypothetical protein TNCV_1462521 [Trichonephila clavipes]
MLPVLGKKAVLEWCMEEGLIGSSYVCRNVEKVWGRKNGFSGVASSYTIQNYIVAELSKSEGTYSEVFLDIHYLYRLEKLVLK